MPSYLGMVGGSKNPINNGIGGPKGPSSISGGAKLKAATWPENLVQLCSNVHMEKMKSCKTIIKKMS